MFVLIVCGSKLPHIEFDCEDTALIAYHTAVRMNPFIRIDLLEMIYYEAYQVIKTSHPTYRNPYKYKRVP